MSIKIRLTILSLLFSFSIYASGDHNPLFQKNWKMLASVNAEDMQATFEQLADAEIDIAGVDVKNKIIDVLIDDYDYQNLKSLQLEVDIREVKGISKGPDAEYKTPEEVEFLINEFADKFPAITKVVSIGKSLEGRDIWAIKISDNPEQAEVLEPSILFNSMHHAREVMGPEVSLDIIEYLLNAYRVDEKITNYIDSYEIWVIPMFNVDGNNKMWNDDKWWRKNTRGGYGVDLNRNYPGNWNKCDGSSGWRYSQTYRGAKPASEPETQAMMDFVKKVRPVFDISYHSYSELVIYPLGCSPERASNKDVIETIGKEIASKINYTPGTAWELLYNADGGDIDWMYSAYQVIPYVIELNARSQGFHPNYSKWRDKTVLRNRAGWLHLMERLSKSGVRGRVTLNNKALANYVIDVYQDGKAELIQTYVGHDTGMYHLVLNPGEYKFVFRTGSKVLKTQKVTIGSELKVSNIGL